MRKYTNAGCGVGEVLLPRADVDKHKWAVVACDQYTSEPDYWRAVDSLVGDAPSTLRLIFPEVYLNKAGGPARIQAIRQAMSSYLEQGVLQPHDGMVYLQRQVGPAQRKGLVLCLDLEQYDFSKGSRSLIRATEGTIVSRLPPRMEIRRGAPLELPHIMVLIDDPQDTVIGPITAARAELPQVYDVELMQGSGHLAGWLVADRGLEEGAMAALAKLGDASSFTARYGLEGDWPVLLYAMGDGNHSLATAKAIWEQTKEAAGGLEPVADDPTRYALVELVNVYDEALVFEPIHRVLFELKADLRAELEAWFAGTLTMHQVQSVAEMTAQVDAAPAGLQRFGFITPEGLWVGEVRDAQTNLAVGTLQAFLDDFMVRAGAGEIDYVHGTDVVVRLGRESAGFYLPGMSKHDLFRSVILDGALPRKTFSMGEAHEKRFYLECRQLG